MIGAVVTVALLLFFGWLLFDKDDWGKPME
jgi:hypothetical protein